MRLQVKGLLESVRARKLAVISGGLALLALVMASVAIFGIEGVFSSNPLKRFAVGSMTKFVFKDAGMPAPGVAFDGPDGPMTLSRLRGKPVLVNLWASWCVPCVKELPSLDRLQLAMKAEGLAVVAINMDENNDDALYFLAKTHVTHLALYSDPNLLMSVALRVEGIPVSVLYNSEGREIGRYVGGTDWDSPEARKLIATAITTPGGAARTE